MIRRERPARRGNRDERRQNRREWLLVKWDEKPRKLRDLVVASSGLLKWVAILVGLFYGLKLVGGVDLLQLITGGGK